jgi:hypothetical protein
MGRSLIFSTPISFTSKILCAFHWPIRLFLWDRDRENLGVGKIYTCAGNISQHAKGPNT